MASPKSVFRIDDVDLLESPDGLMRDSVLITDSSCGAKSMSAGLVWVHPHGQIHEDTHEFDEVYYVIQGAAVVIMDGKETPASAGSVVFIPAGIRHRIDNPHDDVFKIFWLISAKWSDLTPVVEELGTWPIVSTTKGWHLS